LKVQAVKSHIFQEKIQVAISDQFLHSHCILSDGPFALKDHAPNAQFPSKIPKLIHPRQLQPYPKADSAISLPQLEQFDPLSLNQRVRLRIRVSKSQWNCLQSLSQHQQGTSRPDLE
jgi:hypothetical protein